MKEGALTCNQSPCENERPVSNIAPFSREIQKS